MHTSQKAKYKIKNIRSILFRRPLKILVAALLLIPVSAHAENYYWFSYIVGLEYKYPSAQAAANSVLRVYTDNELDNYSNHSIQELVPNGDGSYYVSIIGYYFGSQLSHFGNSIYRRGDSCPAGTQYSTALEECIGELVNAHKGNIELGDSCAVPSVYKADPINIAIGNEYQEVADFKLTSSPLHISRFYNSVDGIWRHNYSAHLIIQAGSARVVLNDGREIAFTIQNDVVSAGRIGSGKLVKDTNSWTYTSPKNEKIIFDSVGRLSGQVSSSGVKQTISNIDSRLSISDGLGNTLLIKQDPEYQLVSFSNAQNTGSYTYNTNRRLTAVSTSIQGNVTTVGYSYTDSRNANLLTAFTDQRGIPFASWTYDAQSRATSSRHAGGLELTTVAYNTDGSVTVVNPLGKSTKYEFQTYQGIKRITAIHGEPSPGCPSSNSTFTYDSTGLLKTKTDAKGFITTYTYNDRGLETSRIEASGTSQARTITTTWHPTFSLPLTVTEPGQKTTYTYDAQGRQTSRTQTGL